MLLNVQVCGKVFQVQPYHIVPGAAAGQYQAGGHVGCSSLIFSTPPSLIPPVIEQLVRGAELTLSSPLPPSCSTPAWSLPSSCLPGPSPSCWLDKLVTGQAEQSRRVFACDQRQDQGEGHLSERGWARGTAFCLSTRTWHSYTLSRLCEGLALRCTSRLPTWWPPYYCWWMCPWPWTCFTAVWRLPRILSSRDVSTQLLLSPSLAFC